MRHELKYLMRGPDAASHVRSRVPALTIEHAPRIVASAYFDSPTYESFQQSTSGASERMKLRLRWYDDLHHATRPKLELKYRANRVGRKVQHPVDSIDLNTTRWSSVRALMQTSVDGADRRHVDALRLPVLIATYHRHYFVTSDKRVRVTVDTDLRFFDQRHRPTPNLRFDSISTDFAVVECKVAQAFQADEARILDALRLRWTRFSKYCYGLGALARL